VGLSLCLLERVDVASRTLFLLGLDLVDGTPVYDVKPYIPWDSVHNGHAASLVGAEGDAFDGLGVGGRGDSPAMLPPSCPLRVPPCVTADDGEFSRVVLTPEARAAVAEARAR